MGHPILLAGGAALAAALLFGSKAHAAPRGLPANNGGGLQPSPSPGGGVFGPTSMPADDSGIPNPGGGAQGGMNPLGTDTDPSVSVPAGFGPAAPTETGDVGTFENLDDTASAQAGTDADGNATFADDTGDSGDGGVSLPSSVSGLIRPWGNTRRPRVGAPTASLAARIDADVAKAQINFDKAHRIYKILEGRYNPTLGAAPPPQLQRAIADLIHYKEQLANILAFQRKMLAQGAAEMKVAGNGNVPTGLVYSHPLRAWTYPHRGHLQGAPPPAGLPVFV